MIDTQERNVTADRKQNVNGNHWKSNTGKSAVQGQAKCQNWRYQQRPATRDTKATEGELEAEMSDSSLWHGNKGSDWKQESLPNFMQQTLDNPRSYAYARRKKITCKTLRQLNWTELITSNEEASRGKDDRSVKTFSIFLQLFDTKCVAIEPHSWTCSFQIWINMHCRGPKGKGEVSSSSTVNNQQTESAMSDSTDHSNGKPGASEVKIETKIAAAALPTARSRTESILTASKSVRFTSRILKQFPDATTTNGISHESTNQQTAKTRRG